MQDNKQTQEYKRDGNTAYVLYAPYADKPDHLTNKIWAKFNADVRCDIKIADEAAELFVEAANVKAETGKGPKELLETLSLSTTLLENIVWVFHGREQMELQVRAIASVREFLKEQKVKTISDIEKNSEVLGKATDLLLAENKALAERVKELERVLGIAKQYVKAWEVDGKDPLVGENLQEHLTLIYETIPQS